MKAGWPSQPLAAVSVGITDGSHNPPKGIADSEYLMLSSKNVLDGDLTYTSPRFLSKQDYLRENVRTRIAGGDVLLTIVGTVGRCTVVPLDAPKVTVQRSVAVVHVDPNVIEPRFLMYSFIHRRAELEDLARGVAQKGIYLETLREIEVPTPPIPEQERIARILDEAFEAIATARANTEQNLNNARELFDCHRNGVFIEHAPGWLEKPLGAFCSFENGDRGTNYPSKSARTAAGIPFINAGHLTQDGISLESMDYISRERFDLLSNGKIRKGDILFCLRGSLGKFASVGGVSEGAIASSLVIVRPDKTVLHEYVLAYFGSQLCSDMVNHFKNGAAQPNLSARSLRRFIVPIPSLPEQQAVVEALAGIHVETQRLSSLYETKLSALETLKQSLLHQAFTGVL